MQTLEFSKWRDAHSKRGTKSAEEKGAGIRLVDEDADDDEFEGEEEGGDGGGDEDGGEGKGDREWAAEEEEVASRMQHRKVRGASCLSMACIFHEYSAYPPRQLPSGGVGATYCRWWPSASTV